VTSVLLAFAQARASFDLVPVLIAAYVLYAVISGIARTAKRANAQRQAPAATIAAPATAAMTAQQVRATLAQRLAAQLAAQQRAVELAQAQRSAAPAAASASPTASASVPIASAMPTDYTLAMPMLSVNMEAPASTQSADFLSALNLPPAALAIVARAVIGPCAAHAGAGHTPEDW